MAVFRVERTGDYTVMSNFHLKDKRLSLKAKGLLSQMLSLPDDWDYTLSGLSYINRESKDAIRSAVNELETAGYIRRRQTTDGEIGLARLFSIWANMMCAPGAATIVGCRPITMLSEILAQVHAYLTVHPLYDPEGLALYVELHHMMDAILMGDWFE